MDFFFFKPISNFFFSTLLLLAHIHTLSVRVIFYRGCKGFNLHFFVGFSDIFSCAFSTIFDFLRNVECSFLHCLHQNEPRKLWIFIKITIFFRYHLELVGFAYFRCFRVIMDPINIKSNWKDLFNNLLHALKNATRCYELRKISFKALLVSLYMFTNTFNVTIPLFLPINIINHYQCFCN